MAEKLWSPNSPFGRENSVFGHREIASLCRRGKARVVGLADAMASITGRVEPAKWTDKWLQEKFVKMGMPRKNGDLVLVFQGEFSQAMVRVAMAEAEYAAECNGYDKMVDVSRSPNGDSRRGMACWTSRPTLKSKTPGGPAMKTRQMTVRYKPL